MHAHCYRVLLDPDPFPVGLTTKPTTNPNQTPSVPTTDGWEVTEKECRDMETLYKTARPGDHLMTPYQCTLCHFRNLFHRNPDKEAAEDDWVTSCILQANLDAFWSRQQSTVGNNLQEMQRVMRISNSMRLDHPLETFKRVPFPLSDTFGMAAAIISLQRSLDKGKNSKTILWDTMRGVIQLYLQGRICTGHRSYLLIPKRNCSSTMKVFEII
ncbi:hypothetical protein ACA910_010230 [Epithemia clementina (nom. ined.)]